MTDKEKSVRLLLIRCGLTPTYANGSKEGTVYWRYPLPVVSDIELKKPKEDDDA